MPVEWTIRDAHPGDTDRVLRLLDAVRSQADVRAPDLVEVLVGLRAGHPALVATVGDDIVGFVLGAVQGDGAWIDALAIAPAWRHQRMGSALLRAIEDRVLHLGARKVSILLGPDQVGAEALRNRGFTATEGLVLYEKLEPIEPGEVGVLDQWGGELIEADDWDLVAGMAAEKAMILDRIVAPLAAPDLARRIGVIAPATVLLFGPPGTGKTTFARAVAGRLGWPFVELLPSSLSASPDGLAAELRRALLELASLEHVVVFIDEMDEVAPRRQEHRAMQSVVNELLKAVPTFRSRPGRLLIGATNWIDTIDPAVIRPGRFDLILPIGPPDVEARTAMWEAAVSRLDCEPVDVAALAQASEGFTPGDVALAAQWAAGAAFDRVIHGGVPHRVTGGDLMAAIDRTTRSVNTDDMARFSDERARHERR